MTMLDSKGSRARGSRYRLDRKLIADPRLEPAWRSLDIGSVTIDGQTRAVASTHTLLNPFSILLHHRISIGRARGRALVVMPMSGHHGVMMRDLVVGLLETHDVSVLDWINARHVPATAGSFGFVENVAAIAAALGDIGPGAHLVGICQSGPAAALALSALHQADAPERPASLILMCSPIEPNASPTRISSLLTLTTRRWLSESLLSPVPPGYPGSGRLVYPGELQQARLMQYLTNHLVARSALSEKLLHDDGFEAVRFPFLLRASQLKDIDGRAFSESIEAIYHDHVLWRGAFGFHGITLDPHRVQNAALMTVETEGDDITAPGQTAAAHRLFGRVPDELRAHMLLEGGSHFTPFHGTQAMGKVVPAMASFMRLSHAALAGGRPDAPAAAASRN